MLKRLALISVCLLLVCATCACKKAVEAEDANSAEVGENYSGYRETMLYYPTDDGFIVPIMKLIPWEEGIGKAALSYLVGGSDNDMSAARMGLVTAIPEGTTIGLRIYDDGNANVDLSGMEQLEDAEAELAMITAVVNTLREFSAVSTVSFTVDGKACDRLPNGTDISGRFDRLALNAEQNELAVSAQELHALTLYFPNSMASLNVPVTRYVASEPTLYSAIEAFLQGPEDARLLDCCSDSAKLISAEAVSGTAVVYIEDSAWDMEDERLSALYASMALTACTQPDVYALELYVNGERVEADCAGVPEYPNEFTG